MPDVIQLYTVKRGPVIFTVYAVFIPSIWKTVLKNTLFWVGSNKRRKDTRLCLCKPTENKAVNVVCSFF